MGRCGGVAVRPKGGATRRSGTASAVAIYIYVAYLVAGGAIYLLGGTCLSGS